MPFNNIVFFCDFAYLNCKNPIDETEILRLKSPSDSFNTHRMTCRMCKLNNLLAVCNVVQKIDHSMKILFLIFKNRMQP